MKRALVAAMVICVAGCGSEPADDSQVLAEIGDRQITVAAFRQELDRRVATLGGGYGSKEQQRELLEALVAQQRLLATAEALELDHDPEVQAAVERVLTSAVRRELEARSVEAVRVTDDEVAAWYAANKEEYARSERRNAAIIQSATAGPGDRARLESVREQTLADGGSHFGQLAIDHSDDRSTRYRGGVVGWLQADQRERYKWPQPVVDAIFSLSEAGDVSDVIDTTEGLYLVRLVALEAGGARPLEEVEPGIRAALRRQKVMAARERALDEMSDGIEVVVHGERLDLIGPREAADDKRTPPALPGRRDS